MDLQGLMQGDGVSRRASLPFRRHQKNFAERKQRRSHGMDAGRVNAIVIGQKNSHFAGGAAFSEKMRAEARVFSLTQKLKNSEER